MLGRVLLCSLGMGGVCVLTAMSASTGHGEEHNLISYSKQITPHSKLCLQSTFLRLDWHDREDVVDVKMQLVKGVQLC